MKRVFALTLFLFCSFVVAENTIIAIVNGDLISLKTIETDLFQSKKKKNKIEMLNSQIDVILQLQQAYKLDLKPSSNDLQNALFRLAQQNNLTIEDLSKLNDFTLIQNDILEEISILNLQRFITKDLKVSEEQVLEECPNNNSKRDHKQIKISQIIVSEIDSQTNDLNKKNLLIKAFLNKLATHIKKGASFEAFAKLHSQHPSYQYGGITDWLSVRGPTLKMLDLLNNNEVSEVYKTNFGLAIAIKVDERFISSKLKECKERVIFEHAEMYYLDWLTVLREQANIEIYYDKLL
jgi:peptidyl-prolyl cis-trans isomerase SurA